MADDGDPWRLLERFPGMSSIGRAIMGKKLDRAFAAGVRDTMRGRQGTAFEHFAGKVGEFTLAINRLACTAAKNW
jgi:hypothetical protein